MRISIALGATALALLHCSSAAARSGWRLAFVRLPLLQLSRADAVLLPSRLFSDIKATSSLDLEQRELAARLGCPPPASVGPAGAQAVAQASKLTGKAAQLLGVDSWS
ncbi:MAG TPA: hypothetical protein VJN18_21745 [Polyangiaceae bacterium]|nr:hypothetical protein [Polyangiaceae bacterium]